MLKKIILLIILSLYLMAKIENEDECKSEVFKFSLLEKTSEIACKNLSSNEDELKNILDACECAEEAKLLLNQIDMVTKSCKGLKGWDMIKDELYNTHNLLYKKAKIKCESIHKK